MRNSVSPVLLASVISLLSGCNVGEEWQDEIHLPPGDANNGEALFVSVGCSSCHSVGDAESIVNPSHRLAPQYFSENITQDGESLMANYNDALTVSQLTDVVAYLQTHYEDVLRPGFQYPSYEYGADGDTRE